MKFEKIYLAWVRNRYDHDFFYLEAGDSDAGDGDFYFAWPAEQFGKSVGERWSKFLGDVLTEGELPEPGFRSGSALHIFLHNPNYGSETLVDCELYINGIFPKRKEVSAK